ncbi:ABC transporter ATP-binding protein [Geodermatophilus sp. DF01-2]|uniref:ABC transporter ATP-binding protein n=1 Tax=Geodermatophilus sp. DF01-2 TaxID=2559610 RepID=UPI0010747D8E|nr:ABC transporter ATP-binding protein [Geodermatophilus sp. DF01_2]TFV63971.1 ABC transporter ATP-binding protein [Geodermatophilus sp. DF01_2]
MTTTTELAGAPVRVSGVTKQYRDARALDQVDLDIESGEFITLLGSSGSGKSTLLNIIAGFTDCDAGVVEVDGIDITKTPPHKRGLGMVFQHYALFPHMTVFDNVAFPLRRRRTPKAEMVRLVEEALDIVQLGHLGKRMPQQLSGGQQQRVALARAIVFRPKVLLMDEPLGALDKRLREQLQLEIKRLHRELGITFVFVTHDQEEALAMSDRIALLRDGRIVQIGTPEELYEQPAERYTAEFLGESNLFSGTIVNGVLPYGEHGSIQVRDGSADGAGSVMVRPEHVSVLRPDEQVPVGCNALRGTVREVIYLGSGRRAEVTLPDGTHVVARTPADRRHSRLVPGEPVVVTWAKQHGQVVADGPPADEAAIPAGRAAVPA